MDNEIELDSNSNPFKDCDSTYIFQQVRKKLTSGSNRSLWSRIESEMQRAGVGGADTYLRSAFSELAQEANDSIARCRERFKLGEK